MKKHKKSLLFLIKFFGVYFALLSIYNCYLSKTQQKETTFICSPVTQNVATQTTNMLNLFGHKASSIQHSKELSIKLFLNNRYIARVIEGCNGISIIILFIAFVIAFSGPIKQTALYIIFGSALIYGVNIIRIGFLVVLLDKFPNQQTFLHNLLFPAIIYGLTFFLWIIWVQKFSNYKNE